MNATLMVSYSTGTNLVRNYTKHGKGMFTLYIWLALIGYSIMLLLCSYWVKNAPRRGLFVASVHDVRV